LGVVAEISVPLFRNVTAPLPVVSVALRIAVEPQPASKIVPANDASRYLRAPRILRPYPHACASRLPTNQEPGVGTQAPPAPREPSGPLPDPQPSKESLRRLRLFGEGGLVAGAMANGHGRVVPEPPADLEAAGREVWGAAWVCRVSKRPMRGWSLSSHGCAMKKHGCGGRSVRMARFSAGPSKAQRAMRTLQEFMGHEDARTTLIYAHYAENPAEIAMVGRAFAAPLARGSIQGSKLSEPDVTSENLRAANMGVAA